MAFTPGVPGVNPFAKKLKPVSSPQPNTNNQSPQMMDAAKRRLASKKSDPGDALDKKQGIKDSPAEDAADTKKKKKSPFMGMAGSAPDGGNVMPNKTSNGIG